MSEIMPRMRGFAKFFSVLPERKNILCSKQWKMSSELQQERKSVLARFLRSDKIEVMVCYLPEDERLADLLAAIGKSDYDAIHDIDRYTVETSCFKCDSERCPVLKRIHAIVIEDKANVAPVECHLNDGTSSTCVRGGYGYVGPIGRAGNSYPELVPYSIELKTICETCEVKSDCGQDKNDNADEDRHDLTETKTRKVSHGGIIAFFGKLFGRKG